MATIELTQGKKAIVDDADYPMLSKYKWHAAGLGRNRDTIYAASTTSRKDGPQKIIFMHRLVAKTPDGLHTDHIDGDGLNNRRSNLRLATTSQNAMNRRRQKKNKTGFRGVSYVPARGMYVAVITYRGKKIYLGTSKVAKEAAEMVKNGLVKYHGEFAKI